MLLLQIKIIAKKYINFREIQSLLIIIQIYIGFLTLLLALSLVQSLSEYSFKVQSIAPLDTFRILVDTDTTEEITSKKLNALYEDFKKYKDVNNVGNFLLQDMHADQLPNTQILFLDEKYLNWKDSKFISKLTSLTKYRLQNPDSEMIPIIVGEKVNLEVGSVIKGSIPDDLKMTLIDKQFIVVGTIDSDYYFWKGQRGDLNQAILKTNELVIAPIQKEQNYGEQMLSRMNYNTFILLKKSADINHFNEYIQGVLAKYDMKGTVITLNQQLADVKKLNQPIIVVTLLIASLLLLLSIFGLVGVALISTTRRKREFGIYFALGSTPRNIGGIIFGEIFVNVTVSFILAIITFSFSKNLIPAQLALVLDINSLIVTFVLVLLITILATFLPLLKLFRIKPIEYIRGL